MDKDLGQDFDMGFTSDEEVERAIDALADVMREAMKEERVTIIDPMRLAHIKFAYSVMKYVTRGTDTVVSYKLNEPFDTMGSVSVEASVLEFNDTKWFARVAEFASNTEVYPLKKDRVRLSFAFNGLTVPIE